LYDIPGIAVITSHKYFLNLIARNRHCSNTSPPKVSSKEFISCSCAAPLSVPSPSQSPLFPKHHHPHLLVTPTNSLFSAPYQNAFTITPLRNPSRIPPSMPTLQFPFPITPNRHNATNRVHSVRPKTLFPTNHAGQNSPPKPHHGAQ
jgi:hypothetical protein